MSDLRELLTDIGDRARVYDVTERALVLGRRRRHLRRFAGTGGAAVVVVAAVLAAMNLPVRPAPVPLTPTPDPSPSVSPSPVAPGPAPVTECVAQRLPMPKGYPAKSVVTAGDPTGRFLAGRAYPYDGRDRLLIWDNGQVKVVRHQGSDPDFVDISPSGVAVANSFIGDNQVTWIYRDGRLSRLKGNNAWSMAVNDSGAVVGYYRNKAAVWRTPSSAPEQLRFPAGLSGVGNDIGSDGTVVGHSVVPGVGKNRAVAWAPDGTMRYLPVPADIGGAPVSMSQARSISGDWAAGYVVAGDLRSGGKAYLVRWNLATGESHVSRTEFPAGDMITASGVGLSPGDVTGPEGRVVFEGGSALLPDVAGALDEPGSANYRSISDDGRTIGGYQQIEGDGVLVVAVVWRCG